VWLRRAPPGQPRQPIGHACRAVGKPGFRIERHCQSWYVLHRLGGNQRLFQITLAPGLGEPDIAGAERIPQMEQWSCPVLVPVSLEQGLP
jgi:hypothetical protein